MKTQLLINRIKKLILDSRDGDLLSGDELEGKARATAYDILHAMGLPELERACKEVLDHHGQELFDEVAQEGWEGLSGVYNALAEIDICLFNGEYGDAIDKDLQYWQEVSEDKASNLRLAKGGE